MENQNRDAAHRAPEFSAPVLPETAAFSASKVERICALLMYLLAFCYVQALFTSSVAAAVWLCVFTAGFAVMTEVLCRGRGRSWESWVWLGCVLTVLASYVRSIIEVRLCSADAPVHAFDERTSFLLLHAYAIYWVLCRSDMLAGGESGHLLPLDALNGMIVFPFRHFFLRIRSAFYALTHLRGEEKRQPAAVRLGIAGAVVAAVVLLVLALQYLSVADARFGAAVSGVLAALTPDWNNVDFVNALFKLLISLPAGAYLFGLIAGTARENPEALRARGARAEAALAGMRRVPPALWTAAMAVFAAVYLAFFALQAGYLFGAFSRTLPEGYTVAEYARQGFFSLCRVMAVNFALLWLVTRSAARPAAEHLPTRLLCTALLAESLAFAVVAASKLALYIDCFGFTPKRLQSAWLILVLGAGCICALYSLWTRKKSARIWILFTGVTLALLHLV